jgi:hypothetical protein
MTSNLNRFQELISQFSNPKIQRNESEKEYFNFKSRPATQKSSQERGMLVSDYTDKGNEYTFIHIH